jgi:formylglycine-generating enzyme required for sulfatase activity
VPTIVLTVLTALAAAPAQQKPAGPVIRFPFDAEQAAKLQADWAKALRLPTAVTNSVGMKLVLIPGGRFDMGPNGSKYRVTLNRAFYLGATEVTLGQYRRFKPGHKVEGADPEFNADDRPAAMLTWLDARAYCEWLSRQPEEKAAGRTYALSTEAQWEWAARAGAATTRHFGDADKDLAKYAWFNVTYTPNPKQETKGRGRQPVGRLLPNAWGLHDMLGNVWEWCDDRIGNERTGESRDPVMRGGSWRSGGFHCTAVAHDPGTPTQKADNIGFRVACVLGPGAATSGGDDPG